MKVNRRMDVGGMIAPCRAAARALRRHRVAHSMRAARRAIIGRATSSAAVGRSRRYTLKRRNRCVAIGKASGNQQRGGQTARRRVRWWRNIETKNIAPGKISITLFRLNKKDENQRKRARKTYNLHAASKA